MALVEAVRAAHAILTANAEDTVTLTGAVRGAQAEFIHHGGAITDPIYFRLDNVAPVIRADENQVLLPGERLSFYLGATGSLRLICNGAAGYSVFVH